VKYCSTKDDLIKEILFEGTSDSMFYIRAALLVKFLPADIIKNIDTPHSR
jgi:hypothetical protein